MAAERGRFEVRDAEPDAPGYGPHEQGRAALFGKFANALCDPGAPIVLPRKGGHVDAEAELAVVIGRRARFVSPENALESSPDTRARMT